MIAIGLRAATRANGTSTDVRLSELFALGRDSLAIHSVMFPRDPGDERPGPKDGCTALLKLEEAPVRRMSRSS